MTICTHNRACILGEVLNGEMLLNEYASIVNNCWIEIPGHFSNAALDYLVIMPNHIHGIIILKNKCRGGVPPPLHMLTFFTNKA